MSTLVPLPSSLPLALQDYLPASGWTSSSSLHHCSKKNSSSRGCCQNKRSSRKLSRPGPGLPFVTLNYSTSLDSRIPDLPGTETIISHPETKAMTHYLRYHHDAILVGVGTLLADDPSLNCCWTPDSDDKVSSVSEGRTNPDLGSTFASKNARKPHFIQPIILDPTFKWDPRKSRLIEAAEDGLGLAPYVVVREESFEDSIKDPDTRDRILALELAGGKIISIPGAHGSEYTSQCEEHMSECVYWSDVFRALYKETTGAGVPIRSVVVEGGARVINSLLDEASLNLKSKGSPPIVLAVVVTVGPVCLGSRGMPVSPVTSQPRINHVRWWSGSCNSVLFGRLF